MAIDSRVVETLSKVTTATLTTMLLKKGLRNVWMRGTRPLNPDQPRLVGPAKALETRPASINRRRPQRSEARPSGSEPTPAVTM